MSTKLNRVNYLDNLKTALTCLVVAHHTSQGYVTIDTGWSVQQPNIPEINNRLIGWLLSVDNAFFMALFFMLSAYFIPLSLEHKTAKRYLWERTKRLGIPIIIFMFMVLPVTGFLLFGDEMSFTDFLSHRYFLIPDGDINFGHTWFLFNLLFFIVIYILFSQIKGMKQPRKKNLNLNNDSDIWPSSLNNKHILLFGVGLTVLTFIIRIVFPPGYWLPLHSFEPAMGFAYIGMFSFGIVAYKQQWFEKLPTSVGILWGVISIIVILLAPPIILMLVGGYGVWAEGLSLNSLVVSAWDSFLCVGLCISLPVLFRQKANGTNRILKMGAKYSFGVYLIHPFIVIPTQIAIINVPLHPMLKFILASIVCIILCYTLCHLYYRVKNNILKKAISN